MSMLIVAAVLNKEQEIVKQEKQIEKEWEDKDMQEVINELPSKYPEEIKK